MDIVFVFSGAVDIPFYSNCWYYKNLTTFKRIFCWGGEKIWWNGDTQIELQNASKTHNKSWVSHKIEKAVDENVSKKWISFVGVISAFFALVWSLFRALWPLLFTLFWYLISRSIDEKTCDWFWALVCIIPFIISIWLIYGGMVFAVGNLIRLLIKKIINR